MPTSHDYDGTIRRVAAAAVTAGAIVNDSSDFVCALALTSAASGASYTAKVEGRVNTVAKSTGAAWTAGQSLAFAASVFTHVVTGARIIAHAAAAAAAGDVTGDVILCLPNGVG